MSDAEQDSLIELVEGGVGASGGSGRGARKRMVTLRQMIVLLGVQTILLPLITFALLSTRSAAPTVIVERNGGLQGLNYREAPSPLAAAPPALPVAPAAPAVPAPPAAPASPASAAPATASASASCGADRVVIVDPHGVYQWPGDGKGNSAASAVSAEELACLAQPTPTFLEMGIKHDTDKVTLHSFDVIYDAWLSKYRCKKFKMLEIGLGCDMAYGPGHSYTLWLDYFPFVDLHFLEYDGNCVRAQASNLTRATVHVGDQADPEVLKRLMRDAGGIEQFDVIIDDGGHTMRQQHMAFQWLFKYGLKPGGLFFMEDLLTSTPTMLPYYNPAPQEPLSTIDRYAGYAKLLMDDDERRMPEWKDPRINDPRLSMVRQMAVGAGMAVFEKLPREVMDTRRPRGNLRAARPILKPDPSDIQ